MAAAARHFRRDAQACLAADDAGRARQGAVMAFADVFLVLTACSSCARCSLVLVKQPAPRKERAGGTECNHWLGRIELRTRALPPPPKGSGWGGGQLIHSRRMNVK